MTPPKGGEFIGGAAEVDAFSFGMTTSEDQAPDHGDATVESSLGNALRALQESAGEPYYAQTILESAAQALIEDGFNREEIITKLLALTAQLPNVNASEAVEAGVNRGLASELIEDMEGELDDDTSESRVRENDTPAAEEANSWQTGVYLSEHVTTDDVPAVTATADDKEIVIDEILQDELTVEQQPEPGSTPYHTSRAQDIVADVLARHLQQQQEKEEANKRDQLLRTHGLSNQEDQQIQAIARTLDLDYRAALGVYLRTYDQKPPAPTDNSNNQTQEIPLAVSPRTVKRAEQPQPRDTQGDDDDVLVSRGPNSRRKLLLSAKGSVAAALLLSLSAGVVGVGTILPSKDRAEDEAAAAASDDELDEVVGGFLDDVEEGVDSEEDGPVLSDDAAEVYAEQGERQAEDGFETVEDFFPNIDAVGETVTNYQECITFINQQYPLEERLPEAWAQATISAHLKYSSDGYLENVSRLNPDMQGLFAQSPDYYDRRFRQIVGEATAEDFEARFQAANEQDKRTLEAYKQLRVGHGDIREDALAGLNAFYAELEKAVIDVDAISPEYEREAISRIFTHTVKNGFGVNDRIAASTDPGEKGIIIELLEEMKAAGPTASETVIDRLDGQSWNQGRIAAANANPVDCSTATLERLLN